MICGLLDRLVVCLALVAFVVAFYCLCLVCLLVGWLGC